MTPAPQSQSKFTAVYGLNLCQIQRLGFILEKIDVLEDEEKQKRTINKLAEYLKDSERPFIALVPSLSKTGCPRCQKWKIIENTRF